jgi:hypothetical protein
MALWALLFGLTRLVSSPAPSYQGKTLSQWIVPFCRQTTNGLDAPGGPGHFEQLQPVRRAVAQFGTNALPFLIASLNQRESALHRTVRQLVDKQPLVALRLADPRVRQVRAIRALAILGPVARPAIRSLAAQLTNSSLSEHAVYALAGMGPDGMRALVDNFMNAPPAGRMQIAFSLVFPTAIYRGENAGRFETNQIPGAVLVEGLSRIVQDSTVGLRVPAIQRLGTFGPAASNAVPALLPLLADRNPMTRHATVRSLGEIGCQSELVVPALTNLLSDPDLGTQMEAISALQAFGYKASFQPRQPGRLGAPSASPFSRRTNLF